LDRLIISREEDVDELIVCTLYETASINIFK
jgi:hypothetical protein